MFPELAGGYHLDRYARIIKISEPPTKGSVCDRFTPMFAADIEILTPEGEVAQGFPIYESVPLPVPAGGNQEGFYLWPRPGTICTVRWVEGRPDHPVIQHIYPMGLSMPDVPDHMGRWQQRDGVHQFVDPSGNWERKTDKDIKDIAKNLTETVQELKKTQAKAIENTADTKTENIAGVSEETAGGAKKITTPVFNLASGTITMSAPSGVSLLPTISDALAEIKAALSTLATHTHPNVGACEQGGSISGNATAVGAKKANIDSLQ